MVGDYTSTSFSGGTAHPILAVANAPVGGVYNEHAATTTFDVNAMTAAATAPMARDKVQYRSSERPLRAPRAN
jgi:hypothetical protein